MESSDTEKDYLGSATLISRSGHRVSCDLDYYRAQPGNWHVQAHQLSRGSFLSAIDYLTLPGLTVYQNTWATQTRVRGQPPDGILFLGIVPDQEQGGGFWCGGDVNGGTIACARGGDEVDFVVDAGVKDLVLMIDNDLARQLLDDLPLDALCLRKRVAVDRAKGVLLEQSIHREIARFLQSTELCRDSLALADARSRILSVIEYSLSDSRVAGEEQTAGDRDQAVHAALLHADERQGRTTALDMALAAGVSQRTLEYAFRRVLGCTPGKYLSLLRLNAAHHALAFADPDEGRVTSVATSLGFTHLSRFAAAYHGLFGEYPSDTLRRRNSWHNRRCNREGLIEIN